MNIALCLSGMPRDIEQSYIWLENSILSVLKENNISFDFFCSFWETEQERINDTLVLNLFHPKKIQIEDWNFDKMNELGWQEFKKYSNVQRANLLGMFYKIYQCNELRKAHERDNNVKYDFVFRLRTELKFLNKLDIQELDMTKHNDKSLFLPHIPHSHWTKDTLAFGKSYSMDIYSNLFSNIIYLNKRFKSSTAEVLLRCWLNMNNIFVNNTSLRYTLRGLK